MEHPTIFNFPFFSRDFLPVYLAGLLAVMQTGLVPPGGSPDGPVSRAEAEFSAGLPLNGRLARSVLAELQSLGNDLGLEMPSASPSIAGTAGAWGDGTGLTMMDRAEQLAVNEFSRNGHTGSASGPGKEHSLQERIERERINSQKILLLAEDLEKSMADLASADRRVRLSEQKLKQAFGFDVAEPVESVERGSGWKREQPQQPETQPATWLPVFEAAMAFMPDQAVFFTNAPGVSSYLRDSGMLQPLPEDRALLCDGWPEALVAGLLWVQAPAWRITRSRLQPEDRPWLGRNAEFLVARPEAGWTAP